jgi:hypothetical protein
LRGAFEPEFGVARAELQQLVVGELDDRVQTQDHWMNVDLG